MGRSGIFRALLTAVGFCLGASALGLAFNGLRSSSLPLVAPFAYEQDCKEKIDLTAPTVTVARARELVADGSVSAVLLDARPEEDHRASALPGALSLPLSFSSPPGPKDVKHLRRYQLVIVYCDSPEDRIAQLQAERLRKAGLPRVSVLKGGVEAYRGASKGKGASE